MRGFLFIFFLFSNSFLVGQVTILITNQPAGVNLFAAGNFNSWNPRSNKFNYSKQGYYLTLRNAKSPLEFKLTKGSWEKVETKEDGNFLPNRKAGFLPNDTIKIQVAAWSDNTIA